jgi:hypothetical protein
MIIPELLTNAKNPSEIITLVHENLSAVICNIERKLKEAEKTEFVDFQDDLLDLAEIVAYINRPVTVKEITSFVKKSFTQIRKICPYGFDVDYHISVLKALEENMTALKKPLYQFLRRYLIEALEFTASGYVFMTADEFFGGTRYDFTEKEEALFKKHLTAFVVEGTLDDYVDTLDEVEELGDLEAMKTLLIFYGLQPSDVMDYQIRYLERKREENEEEQNATEFAKFESSGNVKSTTEAENIERLFNTLLQ